MKYNEDIAKRCIKIADEVADYHKIWTDKCSKSGITDFESLGMQNGARQVANKLREELGFRKRDYRLPDWEETRESIYD